MQTPITFYANNFYVICKRILRYLPITLRANTIKFLWFYVQISINLCVNTYNVMCKWLLYCEQTQSIYSRNCNLRKSKELSMLKTKCRHTFLFRECKQKWFCSLLPTPFWSLYRMPKLAILFEYVFWRRLVIYSNYRDLLG